MAFVRLETGASGSLYGVEPPAGPTWTGYYLPTAAVTGDPPPALEPAAAWADYWGNPRNGVNGGCYVFLPGPPAQGTADALATLLHSLNEEFEGWAYRFLLWAEPQGAGSPRTVAALPFAGEDQKGSIIEPGVIALRTLQLQVAKGMAVSYDSASETLDLTKAGEAELQLIQTRGAPVKIGTVTTGGKLPLTGAAAGEVGFGLKMTVGTGSVEDSLGRLVTGVKYFYESSGLTKSQLFRLLGVPPQGSEEVPFEVTLDPLHPCDEDRTRFTFTATEPVAFSSPLQTVTGSPLTLTPVPQRSGLVLAPDRVTSPGGQQIDSYYATLAGTFTLGGASGPQRLLCGLSGLESVVVNPAGNGYAGDRLAFHPGKPAFAPVFPPQAASLDEASKKSLQQPLLEEKMTTAWASVEAAESQPAANEYRAQAKGSPLFATGGADRAGLLDLLDNPLGTATSAFPLAAYRGAKATDGQDGFEPEQLALYEDAVIAPSRRATIESEDLAPRPRAALDDGDATAVTPQGFMVGLNGTQWSSLLMADTEPAGHSPEGTLSFSPVDPTLQSALQTNQLFLVASKKIPGFAGSIGIQGWPFEVNLGENVSFGSYSNVLIFKFCSGSLEELVSDPRRWTEAGHFNESAEDGLIALSEWLQGYVEEGVKSTDPALARFKALAEDPDWRGVLALRVDVPLDELPAQVSALRCGIESPKLSAHHLGVEVNQLTPDGKALQGPSSLFGLIDYTDPAYAQALQLGAAIETPVAPAPGATYDFKVLKLLVLFENSEVKEFRSICQVTLTQWFGDKVVPAAGSALPPVSILLFGSLQEHDGQQVYSFANHSSGTFPLDSKVLPSLTVATASLETVEAGTGEEPSLYRFPFGGALQLGKPQEAAGKPEVDLLSFDALPFQDVALEMRYDPEAATPRTFLFKTERTALDAGNAAARPQSLFTAMPLTLRGLVTGEGAPPSSLGYADVKLPGTPVSPLGAQWYGLSYNFDLGTPGALASAAGWSATLLVTWGAGSKRSEVSPPRAGASMRLPGASDGSKSLSLQGVLGLAVEDIQLSRATVEGGASSPYLMRFTDIALSLLGVKFPPGYGTAFYLFGNPATTGQRSSIGWYAALAKES